MKLVIVESPAKAKTINKYLGSDFKVMASFGHVRDLPSKNGSVLPEQDFAMKYVISESNKHIGEIITNASKAEMIYLATDPDREGESISWHVAEIIKEKDSNKSDNIFKRVAFNEITKKAVLEAMKNPRDIDINLVNAQQARRALDYLVGFTLSPILWRKLPGCKSAGRVQSVALRLICQREDEIECFKIEEYWDISLKMLNSHNEPFIARLTHANGVKLEKFSITREGEAASLVELLKLVSFSVSSIEKKQQKRQPPPPFITSSLQQEAARKLGYSAKKTMQIAQKLYESGFITYMRTDGVALSSDCTDSVRKFIKNNFGSKYLPSSVRLYKSKVKNAQEAHEAIRPTDITMSPTDLEGKLDSDHFRLYDLIWKRTIACQMENVVIDMVSATLDSNDKNFIAKATGSTIAFDGFYKIYKEGQDDEREEENKTLPPLIEGEQTKMTEIIPAQHFTEPPPRYSEASLVKKLEELGIGRPSTYASILSVLQERKYVSLVKKRFVPDELGRLLTAFLIGFFGKYVEYDFTAYLENELDEVAAGKIEWKELLKTFWEGFNQNVSAVSEHKITDVINYLEKALDYHLFGDSADKESVRQCAACAVGKLSLKLGKFGAFLGCSNYPECNFKKQITSHNTEHAESQEGDLGENNKLLGQDSKGADIFLKKGPYGWYLELGNNSLPEQSEDIKKRTKAKGDKSKTKKIKAAKPKRVPLPPKLLPSDLTIEQAVKLVELPCAIGCYKDTSNEMMTGIGRFGPYIKYRDKFISIPKNFDIFSLTIEEACRIIDAKEAKDNASAEKASTQTTTKTKTIAKKGAKK
jgi:DNA topoisomerase-1